jgi:hypothetical protein
MARPLPGNRWFALARAGYPALHLPQALHPEVPRRTNPQLEDGSRGERKHVTARLAAFHDADQPAERKAITLGSQTSTKQAPPARSSTANG